MTVFETLNFERRWNGPRDVTKQVFNCLQMPGDTIIY